MTCDFMEPPALRMTALAWQQHAVEPPSSETVPVLRQEQTVADGVNSLVQALGELNRAFGSLAS